MIFPSLRNNRFGNINLNLEAIEWMREHNINKEDVNPFLDPAWCGELVHEFHQKFNVDHSYGGWLEDRSTIWRGSYLDKDERYYHLGVDFNIPVGTPVAVCQDGTLMRTDTDSPEEYGWGSRVIIRLDSSPIYLMYAHLQEPYLKKSPRIKAGEIIGVAGTSDKNGGWFPHIHVQAVRADYLDQLWENNLAEVDGYGQKKNIRELAYNFPDPLNFISIR